MIFRLFEYAAGYYSSMTTSISKSEIYPYIFDSTLMLLALVTFNIIHPGVILVGVLDTYPTRRDRRNAKTIRKEKRKFDKAVREAVKRNAPGDEIELRVDGFYQLGDESGNASELPFTSTARLV
jgi:hypothetical protein